SPHYDILRSPHSSLLGIHSRRYSPISATQASGSTTDDLCSRLYIPRCPRVRIFRWLCSQPMTSGEQLNPHRHALPPSPASSQSAKSRTHCCGLQEVDCVLSPTSKDSVRQ